MFPTHLLFPIHDLQLEAVHVEAHQLLITAASTQAAAVCPCCQTESRRVHSRYTRTVSDVPCTNRTLVFCLHVRRFFCDVPHCARKIFAERFGPTLPAYARRTLRLEDLLRTIAFAIGGQGGARIAYALSMPVSPRTLLRLMHAQPALQVSEPRVVGLDDWAWKKGRTYGTICVDLERHHPVDLLPDRSSERGAAWLAARPGVEIIARDRSGGYADGATRGAPQATQVADRWHLLQNLGEALEYFFHQHARLLKQVAQDLNAVPRGHHADHRTVPSIAGTTGQARNKAASQARQARALEIYHRVQDLQTKRVDVANIARQLGVSRQTVYRYLRLTAPPQPTYIHVARPHSIDPFKPYLVQRWNEGCRNATQLWRELRDHYGYQHAPRTVGRFISELRKDSGKPYSFRHVAAAPIYAVGHEQQRPLTALQAMRLWMSREEQRSTWLEMYRKQLCALDPLLARSYTLTQTFIEMVQQRQGETLDQWMTEVQESGISELQSFAEGLGRDYDAVKAGLTLEWSNGQTEAQIHRLKLLKRQMYGRAGFELLRKRVLYRESPLPVQRRVTKHEQLMAA